MPLIECWVAKILTTNAEHAIGSGEGREVAQGRVAQRQSWGENRLVCWKEVSKYFNSWWITYFSKLHAFYPLLISTDSITTRKVGAQAGIKIPSRWRSQNICIFIDSSIVHVNIKDREKTYSTNWTDLIWTGNAAARSRRLHSRGRAAECWRRVDWARVHGTRPAEPRVESFREILPNTIVVVLKNIVLGVFMIFLN